MFVFWCSSGLFVPGWIMLLHCVYYIMCRIISTHLFFYDFWRPKEFFYFEFEVVVAEYVKHWGLGITSHV